MKQTKKAISKPTNKTTAKTASKTKATAMSTKASVAPGVKPAKAVKKPAPTDPTPKPSVKTTAPAVALRREITTENIAACAYTLWDQSGRPHGRDMEFWLKAEQQLKQERQSLAA
jgi:hypothetical protein